MKSIINISTVWPYWTIFKNLGYFSKELGDCFRTWANFQSIALLSAQNNGNKIRLFLLERKAPVGIFVDVRRKPDQAVFFVSVIRLDSAGREVSQVRAVGDARVELPVVVLAGRHLDPRIVIPK